MKLVTVSQMQAIEKEANSGGLTYDQMMENAGQGLADVIFDLYEGVEGAQKEIVGLVGPGNNGGDALIALTELATEGWKTSAYLVKRKKDDLVKRFAEAGGEVISGEEFVPKACGCDRNLRRAPGWYSRDRYPAAIEEGCGRAALGSK